MIEVPVLQRFLQSSSRHSGYWKNANLIRRLYHPNLNPSQFLRASATQLVKSGCWKDASFQSRPFSIFHRKNLQLKNDMTHVEWENEFWHRRKNTDAARRYREEINKLFHRKTWFRKNLIDFRGVYFVLVANEEDFNHVDDIEELRALLHDDNILATTHVTEYQKIPIVIPYRYVKSNEWDVILEKLLKDHSPSMTYTGVMEFIILRSSADMKIDKRLDIRENLNHPLVASFLDYILVDDKLGNVQRALMNYMYCCHRLNRRDLIENAYGRVRNKIKVFSPHFMIQCTELLQDTAHRKDIYHFSDILFHWFKSAPKQLLPACATVALQENEYDAAFKWIGTVISPDERKGLSPDVDMFLTKVLEQFGYSEDSVRWRNNRTVVEGFFSALASTRVFPTEAGAIAIENWFKSIKNESWKSGHFPFNQVRSNTCPLSGAQLKENKLTDGEYHYLAKVVMRQILLTTNQLDEKGRVLSLGFTTTDRREVKSFLSMLYDQGPFDLVVDGMNVYYNFGGRGVATDKEQNATMRAAWLRHMIGLKEKRMRRKLSVLVVFRRHVRRQVDGLFDDFATVWYTSDDTSDDLFFLYAAILCGRQCRLMTLDLLRDFRYHVMSRFDLLTVGLVFKWQQLHQDLVMLKNVDDMTPQKFDTCIHRTKDSWHFPYSDRHNVSPRNWLMLKNLKS